MNSYVSLYILLLPRTKSAAHLCGALCLNYKGGLSYGLRLLQALGLVIVVRSGKDTSQKQQEHKGDNPKGKGKRHACTSMSDCIRFPDYTPRSSKNK